MKRRSESGTVWGAALLPLAWAYGAGVRYRNRYYDRHREAVRAAGVPVISVGNLTVGGTGKTPLVIEIAARLRARGRRPVILTRGYAARPDETADEVREFELALPDVPVVVHPDRVSGAQRARQEHGADCLVLDDGFQHRRLARDLDIVLIDALDPWGGGRLLPAGRLREPLDSLARADWFVVSRTNQAPAGAVRDILETLHSYAPGVPVTKAAVAANQLVRPDGGPLGPEHLRDRRVLAVCGIGNPRSFAQLVETLTGLPCELRPFPDHHHYSRREADRLAATARRGGVAAVVTTRKDWVKLQPLWPAGAGVELLRLDTRIVLADPRGAFEARLRELFPAEAGAAPARNDAGLPA